MDSVAGHRARIRAAAASLTPLPARSVAVVDAAGLVLAEDVVAGLAVPWFDQAAMDGYAVRAADVASPPVSLPVAGVVAAGDAWDGMLPEGAAIRIMTGAPVPEGADLVVPFEWTDRGAASVRVERAAGAGKHIRAAGEEVRAGAVAVAAATRLRPAHLGLLASVGCGEVVVRPQPRVAVIATGAELVAASHLTKSWSQRPFDHANVRYDDLPAGHLPDSNSTTIAAAVRAAGGTPDARGPVADDPATFLALLTDAAADADLVVTTGGVSAGDHDVVKAALADRDAMWFGSVAVKPGRPQGAGTVTAPDGREVPVVCLPGTPVAAYCSFQLFVVPAIRALAGRSPRWLKCEGGGPNLDTMPLAGPLDASPDRTLVLPARVGDDGRVAPIPGHVGHSQQLLADADVLLVVLPGEPLAAGDPVDVIAL